MKIFNCFSIPLKKKEIEEVKKPPKKEEYFSYDLQLKKEKITVFFVEDYELKSKALIGSFSKKGSLKV